MKRILLLGLFGIVAFGANAQRVTDKLDRGIVAVPMNSSSYLVTWRKFGTEYYDTQYNLYRNGTKIASNLNVTNYKVSGASSSDTYQVEAIVKGVAQEKSPAVKAWKNQYFEVKVQDVVNRSGVKQPNAVTNGTTNTTAGYTLNDVSLADVDGDGVSEFIVKRNNDKGNRMAADNKTDFNLYECYKMDGTRLWWIDLGPNLMAGPDEQWDMIGYDWDCDGKAEMIMRGADNMIIHTSKGATINIGNMNYYAPRDEYTHQGAEYLLYLNGETGEPYGWDGTSTNYTPDAYPLPRFEVGESDYAAVWGKNDTGHRSAKHYFGAPYLDGRKPSIFLGRGCYTRHKFCALDVDPATHQLTQRWRWNCYDSKSAWFGNGFHNFAIADVDWDGRDEIVFGSMIIDDTGYGLSTTGYGHGDAQHCGDLDPYRWGQEQFVCLEGSNVPGLAYTNATTSEVYLQTGTGGDNGRCLAGNFTNDIIGSQGRAVGGAVYALSSEVKDYSSNGDSYMAWGDLNMRIYWDGDLLDEIMNSPGVQRAVKITKWGNGRLNFYGSDGQYTPTGILSNSSKNNPGAQGDILGDWREELVLRTSGNDALHVYSTNYESNYGIYSLWLDHQYRNAMVWQCVGYNQPPHVSYFIGEAEGITQAPPPLILEGRTEVLSGATIATTSDHLLVSGYENKTISVQDGASPYLLTVNAPAWVQGTGSKQAVSGTPKQPKQNIEIYTTTLTGGAFSGATRLVKQGEGVLVLPNVIEKHTGNTDVWNGTLQFDGTFESSPLWLNRHTTLISNGGKFMGGLKADYNATIYPGGKDNVGMITTSTLSLGFGSRVVFDAKDGILDKLLASSMTIEAKDWEYGPKYKAPVFQFQNADQLADGEYLIAEVGSIVGKLETINIEGLNEKVGGLSYKEGKLYLVIETMPVGGSTLTWNGTSENNLWDLGVTKNFLKSAVAAAAYKGDNLVFDDQAESTDVVVKGSVAPQTMTFNNAQKNYTLNGDSILGGTIIKNGKGQLDIKNLNAIQGITINEGVVKVRQMANKAGQPIGSIGKYNETVTLNGGTLLVNGVVITDQPIKVQGSSSNLNVASGMSVIFNNAISGSGASLIKLGAGSMETFGVTLDKLTVKSGSYISNSNGSTDQTPTTIELQGGTYWPANNEGTEMKNSANIIVPQGKTSALYGSVRGAYSGKLTGAGTISVFAGGPRTYFDGDWSEFTGTIKLGMSDRSNKGTSLAVRLRNTKGMPNANVQLIKYAGDKNGNTETLVDNEGKDIPIGTYSGNGAFIGSGKWIVGSNGLDFYGDANVEFRAPLVKRGAGKMTLFAVGNIKSSFTIEEGTVTFSDFTMETSLNGTNQTTIGAKGRLVCSGKLAATVIEQGGELMLCSSTFDEETPGEVRTTARLNAKSGSSLTFLLSSASDYSQLQPDILLMNGKVKVVLVNGYVPAAGTEFILWNTTSYSGTPEYDLPTLPEGLYWDTTDMSAKKGVLRVTNEKTGVTNVLTENRSKFVYDLQGRQMKGQVLNSGIYMRGGKKYVVK